MAEQQYSLRSHPAPRPSNASLRIALLGYRSNPFSGGQGVYIRNVARALADRGHLVDVISGEPYPLLPNHPGLALLKLPGLNLFDKTDRLRAL